MEKLSMDALNRLSTDEFKQAAKTPITIILDNVRSMHNVGSVFRTADGFAIEKIYLCGFTPQPPHREIQKTALGATETVAWEYYDDTNTVITELKQQGYQIIAIEQVINSIALNSYHQQSSKLAVIFGNEVDGVHETVIQNCDAAIEIPQIGTKHSFNISVAAGIVLWKLFENHYYKK
jgi:23S rRNA (guanosine2251-2'-O)-methyltransferase